MSVDILGTSRDQCWSMVQWSFTSTETRRFVRTDSPGRPPRLSHSSWTMGFFLFFLHDCSAFEFIGSSVLNKDAWSSWFHTRCLPELQVCHSGIWGGDWGFGMNVNHLFCPSCGKVASYCFTCSVWTLCFWCVHLERGHHPHHGDHPRRTWPWCNAWRGGWLLSVQCGDAQYAAV